jgi:hypothetical protein
VVAAQTLLDQPAEYDRLPYFYTDQYELGMEFTGDPAPDDRLVVRGDLHRHEFVAFWLRGGRLTAAMNVNVWDVGESVRELIRSGQLIDETRLVDPAIPLGQLSPPRPDRLPPQPASTSRRWGQRGPARPAAVSSRATAARPASRRATGTLNGLQET